jgi:hypothetical protein
MYLGSCDFPLFVPFSGGRFSPTPYFPGATQNFSQKLLKNIASPY